MDTKQLNIRLSTDEMKDLKALAEACELTPAALGGFFMRAAIRASKKLPHRLTVPIDFEIVNEPVGSFRLNEPKPLKRT